MVKRKKENINLEEMTGIKRNVLTQSWVILGIVIVVIVLALMIVPYFKKGVQMSEEINIMTEQQARSLIYSIGENGVEWFCGQIPTITNKKGNVYGSAERAKLEEAIGYENKNKICSSFASPKTPASTSG